MTEKRYERERERTKGTEEARNGKEAEGDRRRRKKD